MLGEVYKTVVDFFEPIVTLGQEGKKDEALKPHQQVQQALLVTPKRPQAFCHSPYSFDQQPLPQQQQQQQQIDIHESKHVEVHTEEATNPTNRIENTSKLSNDKSSSKKNKQKGRRTQGNNPPPVCLDYLKGMCNQRRWKCKYAHPPLPVSNTVKEESTEVVCDVWILTGFCKFGDGCRNYHPPLEESSTNPIAPPLTAKYHQQSQKRTKKRRPRNNVNSQTSKAPSEVAEVVDDKSDSEDEATPSTPLTPPVSSANTVMKKVQGILNKITIQKFEPLFYQLFELLSSSEITVQQIIPVLFSKAIAEPHLSGVYGQLCSRIYFWSNPQQQTALCSQLLHLVRTLLEAEDLTSGMAEEQLARMQVRRIGNMQFFGELFLQGLVNEYQVTDVIYYLLEKAGPNNEFDNASVAIELTCKLLTCIGQQLDINSSHTMDFYLQHLYELSINHSNRIKILVHNAIELRSRSWIGRHDEHRHRVLSYNDFYQVAP